MESDGTLSKLESQEAVPPQTSKKARYFFLDFLAEALCDTAGG